MITIRSIRSAAVRRSDEFSFTEEPPTVRHIARCGKPYPISEIVGAYAIAELSDNTAKAWYFDTRALDAATNCLTVKVYPEDNYRGLVQRYALMTLAKEGIFRS